MKKLDEKQIDDLATLIDLVTSLLKGALHLGDNNSKLSLAFSFLERLKKDLKSGVLFLEDMSKDSKGEKSVREKKKGSKAS
jgi:hypothetical protein